MTQTTSRSEVPLPRVTSRFIPDNGGPEVEFVLLGLPVDLADAIEAAAEEEGVTHTDYLRWLVNRARGD